MDSYYKNRLFDVIVIGGGISGLGIALECASKGFETIVIEKGKICSETSDNSLRIIHGGFRYLQTLNVLRVIESIREQGQILREAPSLVKLLPCIMPLSRFGLKSRGPVEIATRIYNSMCENIIGISNRSGIISSEFVDKHVSMIKGGAPHGALLWYDARLRDPHKFASLIHHKIDREGGEILQGVEATGVRKQDSVFVVSCRDLEEPSELCARVVVNAAGPMIDSVKRDGNQSTYASTQWSRAFNIVLNKKLQERFAIGGKSRSGRLFFAVPRAQGTAIGTGYLPLVNNESKLTIAESELSVFLEDFNDTFRLAKLTSSDIDHVEVGIIPVRAVSDDGSRVRFYGRSKITDQRGFIEVLSTKYTTFHGQGQRVLRSAIRYLR